MLASVPLMFCGIGGTGGIRTRDLRADNAMRQAGLRYDPEIGGPDGGRTRRLPLARLKLTDTSENLITPDLKVRLGKKQKEPALAPELPQI